MNETNQQRENAMEFKIERTEGGQHDEYSLRLDGELIVRCSTLEACKAVRDLLIVKMRQPVTMDNIRELSDEAFAAGDERHVQLCLSALTGDRGAIEQCGYLVRMGLEKRREERRERMTAGSDPAPKSPAVLAEEGRQRRQAEDLALDRILSERNDSLTFAKTYGDPEYREERAR